VRGDDDFASGLAVLDGALDGPSIVLPPGFGVVCGQVRSDRFAAEAREVVRDAVPEGRGSRSTVHEGEDGHYG
jgi:hypothetical protein